jgi:outer membrane lipoprotein SlyB
MKSLIVALVAVGLTGCASLDAAHIEGVKHDAEKYRAYSEVETQKQVAVQECFRKASTDSQFGSCALMGVASGMAGTFGGRPTAATIAPTTGQLVQGTVNAIAPYAAAASIARSVADVQAKDPVVVEQQPPLVVRPEVVNPIVIGP